MTTDHFTDVERDRFPNCLGLWFNGETDIQPYILSAVFLGASAVWYLFSRIKPSVWILSLYWLFFGVIFPRSEKRRPDRVDLGFFPPSFHPTPLQVRKCGPAARALPTAV